MDTLTSNALVTIILATILGLAVILSAGAMVSRWIGPAVRNKDPIAQIATNTNMISGTLDLYERQIKALREQMDGVERDRKTQLDRVEAERKLLFERVDHADALNRTLGDKLIAITDKYDAQCLFTDRILNTLDATPGGAGWAVELRKTDPRNAPPHDRAL